MRGLAASIAEGDTTIRADCSFPSSIFLESTAFEFDPEAEWEDPRSDYREWIDYVKALISAIRTSQDAQVP